MSADVVLTAHDLGMSDDSRAECCRQDYMIERIETVRMTAQQYEQAVNALATLIVEWTTGLGRTDGITADHPDGD